MIKEWISIITNKSVTLKEFERSKICGKCKHKTYTRYLELIKSEIKDVQGYYCNKCKCPLISKLKTDNPKHICDKWL